MALVCGKEGAGGWGRGQHKKQMADEREETGHGYGTYNDCFGLSTSKGYEEHKRNGKHALPCIISGKLTVRTLVQPWHCAQGQLQPHTQSSSHVRGPSCGSVSHVCSHTQRRGRWTLMLAVQTPGRTDRKKQGIQHARWVVHTMENRRTCRLIDKHF